MKTLVMMAAILLWSSTSEAQRTDVVTGPHGGKMQEVAGTEVELLVGEHEVMLCVYSWEDVPLDARRYKAVVTVVSGPNRQKIELQPTKSGRLGGTGTSALRPYSALSLQLTTPDGVSGTVEF